jgi:glycosyltransferase involved in cell wall biosynthesis
VILPTEEIGGHELWLVEWLQSARGFGLEATIFCRPNKEFTERLEAAGLRWVEVAYTTCRKGLRLWARFGNFIRTLRVATQAPEGAPVLLAPGAVQLALLPFLACIVAGRPVACYVPLTHAATTLRLSRPALRDWLTARVARRVGMWITSSEELRLKLQHYWRIRNPIHIVPNRTRNLAREPKRPVLRPNESSHLEVVFLGRFSPAHKGLDWLAQVLTDEPHRMAHYRFTFQGRGEFRGALEALSSRLGPERVRILPWGSTAETLATADVLILTSRYEGVPFVGIEAIWAGVPVVATFESGLTEFLPQQCLFTFGDSTGFLAALERMRSPKGREEAVAYAQEKVRMLLAEDRYRESMRGVMEGFETLRSGKGIAARVG